MKKKTFKYVALFGIFLLVTLVTLQLWAIASVENFLEKKIPEHIHLDYEKMEVNILTGKIQFNEIVIKISNRANNEVHSELDAKQLAIRGLSFLQFFIKNRVAVRELLIVSPNLKYDKFIRTKRPESDQKGVVKLVKTITIEKSIIEKGSFVVNSSQDSTLFKVAAVDFELIGAETSPELITNQIPLTFESYLLSAEQLTYNLGDFESLDIDKINVAQKKAIFTNLNVRTIYSKDELSEKIRFERDHVSLKIPEVELAGIEFGFADSRLYFDADFGFIDRPLLELYRDKRLVDVEVEKPLYGKMLRTIPTALAIDSVHIDNGKFQYEEITGVGFNAGMLFFDQINAAITNISNTYGSDEKTAARFTANMMGAAPIELKYEFASNDPEDNFQVSGSLKNLNTATVDTFLRPNVGVQTSGTVEALYFTASGTNFNAVGDLKMKYSDFGFEVLQNDKSGINKVVTAIGNLLINKGDNSDKNGFRHGKITVERDGRKSFFNYLWLMVQDGILSSLVGKSEKKKD